MSRAYHILQFWANTSLQLEQTGPVVGVEVIVILKIAAVKPIWVNFNQSIKKNDVLTFIFC